MKQAPIQQKQDAHADKSHAEAESEGKSMSPPAFQLMASSNAATLPVQRKENSGGLSNDLVNGFQASTGHDLSDVNVHKNSSKPSKVGALAYAQGNDIHLGAGQEQHLPHEAAHIVQQREGRVKPTTEVAGKPVNDNAGLESEADRMGDIAQRKVGETVQAKMSDGHATGVTMQRFQAPIHSVLDAEDIDAIAQQVNKAIAGLGTDEEGVYVALQKLNRDPIEIAKLKTKYKADYKQELEAAIRGDFSSTELVLALELIGIKDDAAAVDTIASAIPTTTAQWDTLIARLETAMNGAGTDEEAIYASLIPFDRRAAHLTRLKTKYTAKTKRKLEDDLVSEMSDSELSYALFLLNAPGPETTLGAPGIGLTGSDQATSKVPGGDVTVRTGDEYTGTRYDDLFSLEYEGGLASETKFLQFIWREILSTDAAGKETALADRITTTGGSYNLTADPSAPSYNTDSASASSPFYETAGLSGRTADSTTIHDMPSSMNAKVQAQFAAGATKVVSRAHFSSFLIRDFRPMNRTDITVEWTYTSAALPPRVQTVDSNGACSSLPEGMKKRLVAQYPAFSYIE